MFVAVCYHVPGWELLECLVKSLERCGCTNNRYVFINTHGDTETHREDILERLPNSEFHSINVSQEKRIPVNRAWKYAAELAKKRGEDFFFCDHDVVFFARNAVDILYDEFLQKNCRMCGTLLHDPQGIYDLYPPGLRERAGGLHAEGVAFFDKDIIDVAYSIHGCPDDIPYDVWCKEHFLANFSVSSYGQHRFAKNIGNLEWVEPYQFFHHGCRDTSLWEQVVKHDHWSQIPELLVPETTY